MLKLAEDHNRTLILLVNDYNAEFGVATKKLSDRVGRKLTGIVLVDERIKRKKQNKLVSNSDFIEVICNYEDPQSITRALKPYMDSLLAVNASSERNQPYYQKLIPHIPFLNVPTESSIVWSTHKDMMREQLHAYDSSISPKSTKVTKQNFEQKIETFREARYPLISKPVGLAASILVNKASNFSDLKRNVTASFEEIEAVYSKFRGRGAPCLIVEEYMTGDMFSVDAYIDDAGKSWILPPVKVTTAASIGMEGYYSYRIESNHDLSDAEVIQLNIVAAKSMHAVGLKNSAAHIELFLTTNGWKIIELGPRAGGYRQDMYSLTYGIDHALNELLLKVGLTPEISDNKLKESGVINIYADSEGIIESINGYEEVKNLNGIHRLTQHAVAGDRAIFCGNGGNFIFDGVIYGNTQEELRMLDTTIRNSIHIKVEDQ